jgi:hypothetical protein
LSRAADLIDSKPIEKTFIDLHKEVGLSFLMESARGLKSDYGQIVTKDEVDDFISLWNLIVAQYIREDALSDLRTIIATSKDDAIRIIQGIIDEGMAEGLGIPEMRRRLEKEIPKQWRKRYFRAEVIARTETGAAAEHGSFVGAESTGLLYDKMWITTVDGKERATHRAINGQVVGMHERFDNGLLIPNEKGKPAAEVVNCRCSAGYIRPS